MRIQRSRTIWVGLLLTGLLPLPLLAQSGNSTPGNSTSGKSTNDGIYTVDQAQQGEALYSKQCAACHGAKLEGSGQNPPLAGNDFMTDWKGRPLADLDAKIHDTMPATNPGSLSPDQTVELLAFILKSNNMPAGTSALPNDPSALKSIQISAAAPKP